MTPGEQRRGTPEGRPWFVFLWLWLTGPALSRAEQRRLRSSGKRGLTVQNEHVLVVAEPRCKRVVLVLEPGKLGFQVANTLLETAHFRDHTRVGTADVAK
jgi:hypothetical protein